MEIKKFQITNSIDERVDVYLARELNITRSHVKKLCDDGALKINGKTSKSNKTLKSGDQVEICLPDVQNLDVEPEDIPLKIVYQDQDLVYLINEKE